MTSETKINDIVYVGTIKDTENRLKSMECKFLSASNWIQKNFSRTERSVTLVNLLNSSAQYLNLASTNLEAHIAVLALSTRCLYEINLRTRSVIISEENMRQWHSEAITDKIQVLEGILNLHISSHNSDEREILRKEIERLLELRKKYNLPAVKKPLDAGVIAEGLGLSHEHRTLFKLITKLVHPSSYLINDYSSSASIESRIVLQTHMQLYAWDTFNRICNEIPVPKELSEISSFVGAGNAK